MDILKQLFEHIKSEVESEERMKVEVGDMNKYLLQKAEIMRKEKRRLHDEMELKKKELELKFKREIDEAIEPIKYRTEKIHDEFWNAVYKELNLDPNEHYTTDIREKKIYQYVDTPFFDRS